MILACLSLVCSFNRGHTEDKLFEKLYLMFLYVCFVLGMRGIGFVYCLKKGLYMRRVFKCAFAFDGIRLS